MDRQLYWIEKGYTKENIECHLNFERRKSKESRDKRKKNNENNKEIIQKIKKDLVDKCFYKSGIIVKILSISPSVDGVGFWFKYNKTFKDNSNGIFREFGWFKDYEKSDFLRNLYI